MIETPSVRIGGLEPQDFHVLILVRLEFKIAILGFSVMAQ